MRALVSILAGFLGKFALSTPMIYGIVFLGLGMSHGWAYVEGRRDMRAKMDRAVAKLNVEINKLNAKEAAINEAENARVDAALAMAKAGNPKGKAECKVSSADLKDIANILGGAK